MSIKQAFKPAPGRIAVVREAVDVALSRVKRETDGKTVEILGADGAQFSTDVEYRRAINPWALVVGVGDPRLTDYGTTITTDVKPGDKVLIAEIGKNVKLSAADGQEDYIYVLPFEGVMGSLQWECAVCGHRERTETDVCPECPTIVQPGIADVLGVMI